jgi:polyvinyl alcohol dehydrogenase (cytochrome)
MMFLNTLSIIIALVSWNNVIASEWWNGWSPNDNNDRYQREPLPVTPPTTKTQLKLLWYTKLNGPAQMTPTIYQHFVYLATWTGTFYCLYADNGAIVWQRNLSNYIDNGCIYVSRTSPLVYDNMIILGLTDIRVAGQKLGNGSYVIAFDRFTGVLLWQNRVSSHPASRLTTTPQLANERLFVGISSIEEDVADDPTYPCCTFQASVVALNASTGTFLWESKMMPDNNGTRTGFAGKLSLLSNLNFCQNHRN